MIGLGLSIWQVAVRWTGGGGGGGGGGGTFFPALKFNDRRNSQYAAFM